MACTELGTWGPCTGGNHATEMCFSADPLGCHPINSPPFATADLTEGAGNFDDNAAGTGTYTVTCPQGVDPCPAPNGTDYTALQSGEYTVTYTKTVGGVDETCTFPLYIGARGLRVELEWNYQEGFDDIDLDLHMKQPMSTLPWASGSAQDCGFANCTAFDITDGGGPTWFPANNMPPDPVNWYKDPVHDANSCYFAPAPEGAEWESYDQGCHSPRLDVDNIFCEPSVTDPTDSDFCTPENINIDFPPKNQWIRIATHVYPGTTSFDGTITPTVKIFCDGALAAELGPTGYYDPPAAFTMSGASQQGQMWLVADVLFREDECVKECIVEPLYVAGSPTPKQPVVLTSSQSAQTNGPPYPPVP